MAGSSSYKLDPGPLEPSFIWEPYTDDLIESFPDYCHAGRDMWRVRVPIFCWDVVEVHLPDRVMRQFRLQQAHHIHSMIDKAKSLGDTPSYEDLYMFRKMVLDQSFDCLRYVHEDDRIHVSADYRRDKVQPDQLRPPIRR
ncbi:putative UDP-glucose flavonoid 3-O-glucosyltransferase 3-like [Capsicum annuum]|nr:putative UDP-glucose flavonoid 3-O-glucosyltransferase 3-like [Capsicum annuum]